MIDALKSFAFGQRGPDALRNDALLHLKKSEHVGNGPHRMFIQGRWTEVQLFAPKIHQETDVDIEDWELDLSEAANDAMLDGDLKLADHYFEEILRRSPDNISAKFNQAAAWLRLGDKRKATAARQRVEELHRDHPEYFFATVAMANFLSEDGEHEEARQLLAPLSKCERLHISEAKALLAAQATIAMQLKEFTSAEDSYATLKQIAGDDDPMTESIGRRLAVHQIPGQLANLLKNPGVRYSG